MNHETCKKKRKKYFEVEDYEAVTYKNLQAITKTKVNREIPLLRYMLEKQSCWTIVTLSKDIEKMEKIWKLKENK